MPAILFGSISSLADTSELQRQAFNAAFAQHGLDWNWTPEEYPAMLERSGGEARIAEFAAAAGLDVDAKAVHDTKSELFQSSLARADISAREGVAQTIHDARANGLKVGLVTTTSAENVAALIEALAPQIQASDFDTIVDVSAVSAAKPDKAAYLHALQALGETAATCVAIEDNLGGVTSAQAAGLVCVAFPNANTAGHDFAAADRRVDSVSLVALRELIPSS